MRFMTMELGRNLIDNDDRGDIWSRPYGGLVGQGNPGGPFFPDGLCCPAVVYEVPVVTLVMWSS